MNLVSILRFYFFCAAALFCSNTHGLAHVVELVQDKKNFVDVVVIGGGPAGLSAASCVAREKKHVVVLMGPAEYRGGQLMASSSVDNMPGFDPQPGYEIMEKMERQTREWRAWLVEDEAVDVQVDTSGMLFTVTTKRGLVLHALAVIVATGSTARKLEIPGAQTYDNNGIYTCAVCETLKAEGTHTAVVGGGDGALDAVMHLHSSARRMTVIVRKEHMRASHSLQNKIKEFAHVDVLYNREPVRFEGDGNKLTTLVVRDILTNYEESLPIECVFLAIGHVPHSELVKHLVNLDTQGYIILDGRSQRTSHKGIFAAGDVTDSVYRQASAASGDGGKSGLDALSYLHEQTYLTAQDLKTLEPYYFKPAVD